MLKTLNFPIKIEDCTDGLFWPEEIIPGKNPSYSSLNREYEDYTGSSWLEAEQALNLEKQLLKLHLASKLEISPQDDDEDTEQEIFEYLCGIDEGVASTVLALSAAGCLTYSSCNGGLLGDYHGESYPLVMFYSKPEWVPTLTACATKAKVGLRIYDGGLQVYSDDLRKMLKFAAALIARKRDFSELKGK